LFTEHPRKLLEEHEEFSEGERLETAAEAAARCAASTLWARATICSKAAVQLCEQARLESGVPADDADIQTEHKRTKDGFLATRVVVSKQGGALNKLEVVHIMSNYDVFGSSRDGASNEDPTIWLESTRDTKTFTVHITPRTPLKRWDTGPPTADTDALDKSWDSGQPPDNIDASQDAAANNTHTHPPGDGRPTHSTHPQIHIHAGRLESGRGARTPTHAHPPPTPDHPSFPDTPHQGRSECSPCSIGAHVFNRKNTNSLRCAAGRHARIDSGS
jgi:hypothetical protein